MKRVVLAIVASEHSPWQKAPKDQLESFGDVRGVKFHVDEEVLFLIPHRSGTIDIQMEDATSKLKQVFSAFQDREFGEVYVAAHGDRINWEDVESGMAEACTEFTGQSKNDVYQALRVFVEDPTEDNYDNICRAISSERQRSLAQRISVLKHRLSHFFLPVVTDLQGWQESGYEEAYWQEITDAHNDSTNWMEDAKALIYGGKEKFQEENVRVLVKEAGVESSNAWKKLRELIPKIRNRNSLYYRALKLLSNIEEANDKEVRKDIKGGGSLRYWFGEMEEAMEELRVRIEEEADSERKA